MTKYRLLEDDNNNYGSTDLSSYKFKINAHVVGRNRDEHRCMLYNVDNPNITLQDLIDDIDTYVKHAYIFNTYMVYHNWTFDGKIYKKKDNKMRLIDWLNKHAYASKFNYLCGEIDITIKADFVI